MGGERVPRAGVVVGHEVPEVEGGVHGRQVQFFVVLRAGGTGGREEEPVAVVPGGVGVEGGAGLAQEEDEVVGAGAVGGVFPVDVEAVEAEVLEEVDG